MNDYEKTILSGYEVRKTEDEMFTITIIEENEIRNICLNDFSKNYITFGRGKNNDIILQSRLVSEKHGYFEIENQKLKIVDCNSTNGIYVNNNRIMKDYLRDGDSIKIDNPIEPLSRGIIIIVTIGDEVNKWKQFDLSTKKIVSIGRSQECDIVLNHISVSLNHAYIIKNENSYILKDNKSTNGIIINGYLLKNDIVLKERDVILIANAKLIYHKGRIIYQTYERGVRVDAIDIVKTVKVKGKKKDIAQHVNLTVKSGEFVALVGGSGAGKSTFMNCINGVSRPTSGKVYINGNELFSNYNVLKNIIGYVPQQDIVFADLTLIDMLKYAANLRMPDDTTYSEKEERIKEVLDIVELSDKKDVMIKNLSGGQRKRASIAVELIADPKLFFLDEPTSGLDPGTERSIMKTLRNMSNHGKTIILVTHTTLNLYLCDKIVFLGSGGKLCFAGKPADALKFFGVNDFVDIYTLLNSDTNTWYQKFNSSTYNEKVIASKPTDKMVNRKNQKQFFKQFITLSKRYVKTIFNNKQQLMLLFLQAPICAYLLSLVISDKVFENYDDTKTVLFSLATTSIWLGLLNSIQEICKERIILKKEYMANLKLSAYLASKIFVQCIIGFIQATLLVTFFTYLISVPTNGVTYSWYTETILACFVTIISASSIGLVVSTLSKNSTVAMSFAPLLLVPQLLFSGMLFKLDGFVEKISNIILCRWSVEAFGTTNNLNNLPNSMQELIPNYVRESEDYYTFTAEHFFGDIGIMIFMAILLLIICYIILKKQLESSR